MSKDSVKDAGCGSGDSFVALFSGVPNHPSTIVCIGVQWNHPNLSGCAP